MEATMALQTINSRTSPIVCRGKEVGTRHQIGVGKITEARKMLREAGMSANQANRAINEYLSGTGGNIAWAHTQALLERARSKGQFGTTFDEKENGFVLRGSIAPTVKAEKRAVVDPWQTIATELGMTVEELKALKGAN